MTHTGIECFLAVCRHKTGIAAAQALYITQPSLSARLKNLESQLGGPLFYRRKGSREMLLTPAGKAFYELALQYEALLEKMEQVCHARRRELRISSFNSLGTYLLPAVCERFLQEQPQIGLELQDMELLPASQSLLNGQTDIAFTTGKNQDAMLKQFPVFSEPMVLVAGSKTRQTEPITLRQLRPEDEVYIEWNSEYGRWHQKLFREGQPRIRISVMAHLRLLLEKENSWAIVPASVAEGLEKETRVQILKTAFPLPKREVSCLMTAAGEQDTDVQAFLQCLHRYLSDSPRITSLWQ